MDPVTIITTALVAGAAAGGKDAASAAVRDAYAALRNRLQHSAAHPDITAAIEANEQAPGSNAAEVDAAVAREGLAADAELNAAATTLLALLPPDRIAHGHSRIDLGHAQGVQIGDRNTQHNTFR